jgi:PAS domain S-box-containing protein
MPEALPTQPATPAAADSQRVLLPRLGMGRLFWTMRDAVVVVEAVSAKVVAWNPAAEKLLGYAAADVIGRPADVLVPERLLGAYHERLAEFARTGHAPQHDPAQPIELPVVRRNGTEIVVELVAYPIDDADVPGHFVHATLRDATARRAVETALRVETERYRLLAEAAERAHEEKLALLESAAEGIYGVDAQGRCTFANPAAAFLLGYGPEELLGQDMHALVHHHRADGTVYPQSECPIAAALATGEAAHRDDELLWRKDETSFNVEYTVRPVRHLSGETGTDRAAAVVVFRDSTDRVRREEAERERTRLSGAMLMARTVAHELNNAISPIMGGADLLRLLPAVDGDARASAYLRLIEHAAAEAAAKVRRLQGIVRLEELPSPLGEDLPILDVERSTVG